MRSSKSRSRSKSNRPRTLGNVVNRVFDSSGPEGKVRGTPTQIIEKYLFLARDAQLSNDRVAAENFLQHAEHYTRMLGEAQREMAAEQDTRRPDGSYQQNGQPQMRDERQGDQPRDDRPREDRRDERPRDERPRDDRQRDDRPRNEQPRDDRPRNDQPREDRPRNDQPREDRPRNEQPRNERSRDDRPRNDQPREERPRPERPRDERPREERRDDQREIRAEEAQRSPVPEVIDLSDAADETGLVETPETRSRSRAPQRRRSEAQQPSLALPETTTEAPQPEATPEVAPQPMADAAPADAPVEKAERPRRPRAPRKPKASAEDGDGKDNGPSNGDPREAAE